MAENKDINKNFDDAIKSKLKNYSLPVDNSSWSEIEKRLKAKIEKRILWTSISGIAVAASIAAVWLIIPFNKQVIYYDTTAKQEQIPSHETGIAENVLERKNDLFSESPIGRTKPSFSRREKNDTPAAVSFLPDYNVIAQVEESQPDKTDSLEREKANGSISFPKEIEEEIFTASITQSKKRSKSMGFQVGSGSFLAMNNSPAPTPGLRSDNNSYLRSDVSRSDFEEVTHFLPLSFGLNFRKEINRYLSVESGLTYTYLYSKLTNKLPKRDAKLELHYLGIPLNLVVSIYKNKYSKWNIYASAGGMVEKGLLSYVKKNGEMIDGVIGSTSSHEKIDGFQWSTHAMVGIDYKIIKNYSIYIEPNVNYYLDNNQPVNARTEHPLVFGINAGFRYTW
jgi:hypothetical protein